MNHALIQIKLLNPVRVGFSKGYDMKNDYWLDKMIRCGLCPVI
jgi:hypothetical protein